MEKNVQQQKQRHFNFNFFEEEMVVYPLKSACYKQYSVTD